MKYFYKNTNSFRNKLLMNNINEAAIRLTNKMLEINFKKLNISQYNANYLMNKFKNPTSSIQMNCYLLYLCLDDNNISKEKFSIIDYGGGSGVFSLLAKEYGINKVIYNDIYDVSCDDIKILSKALNLNIDENICGDITDLIMSLKNKNLFVNALSSYDVIEHIYDIEHFMRNLKNIPNNNLRVVLGSGANERNPIIKRQLQKKHHLFEYTTRLSTYGHKKRDSLKSFLKIREEIISEAYPHLDNNTVKMLASKTRGLIKKDIINSVNEFIKDGKMAYSPNHPTNSCDPLTGNWNEQLMNPDWLKDILNSEGFKAKVLPGFWGKATQRFKTIIKRLINIIIAFSGRYNLLASPYYVIYANKKN